MARVVQGFVVALALVMVCAPLSAQLTEKQALKAFQVAAGQQQMAFKQSSAEAVSILKAQLKSALADAKAGEVDTESVQELFDQLCAFQLSMMTAAKVASDLYVELTEILAEITPDDEAVGLHPRSLTAGGDGVLDEYRDDIAALLAKPYPGLRKALAKYVAFAEKNADWLINVRLDPPRGMREPASNGGTTNWVLQSTTIDVVMASGPAGSLGGFQRQIRVAGAAAGTLGTVRVSFAGPSLPGVSTVTDTVVSDRFGVVFVEVNFGLPRANYIIQVRDLEGTTEVGFPIQSAIGLR